nr:hypothetical protein [Tanacetum cinerariifolium]
MEIRGLIWLVHCLELFWKLTRDVRGYVQECVDNVSGCSRGRIDNNILSSNATRKCLGPKKSVISQSVKDDVQRLVDDDLVSKDKIETSLRNVSKRLESELQNSKKRHIEIVEQCESLKKGREDSNWEQYEYFTDNIFTMHQWCSKNFPQGKEQLEHLYNELLVIQHLLNHPTLLCHRFNVVLATGTGKFFSLSMQSSAQPQAQQQQAQIASTSQHQPAQQLIYQVIGPLQPMYPPDSNFYVRENYAYMPNALHSQATMLPQAFQTMTPQDPSWNMDTGASSHLADNTVILTSFSNSSIYPSVFFDNGHFIPVIHIEYRFLHTSHMPLHLNHILVTPHIIKNLIYVCKFTCDNDVSVKFDAYCFSIKITKLRSFFSVVIVPDIFTHPPSPSSPFALLSFSHSTWHRRLGHPGDNVTSHLISCNKSKSSSLCHACQYKDRLVANGQSQQQGIDCDETFSSIVKPTTIHTVLSLAVSHDWPIHHLDVKNAFLHVHLSETVYMHQPPNFVNSARRDYSKTNASLFGYHFGSDIAYLLSRTPVDTESKIGPDGDSVSDSTLFRSLAGALRRYVHGTLNHGLQLHVSTTTQLTEYTDADWAEAEYHGVANVVAETAWIHNLLLELHAPLHSVTLVYCDNVSVVYLSTNLVQHQRTKHIEIDIHFVRDYVASRQVHVLHVSS